MAAAAAALLPLPGLEPATYARSHAAFEARSDQRSLVTRWLGERLTLRGGGPVRVLSVGCGDGELDAVLAAGLAQAGAAVTFDGVEPFAGSADRWERALSAVPGVTSRVTRGTLAEHVRQHPEETYDVVMAVHSLYYFPDLPGALTTAHSLLAGGGELVVLHAPRAELNTLVTQLAPRRGGHPQWFSETVAQALAGLGESVQHERLQARLDLAEAGDDVFDFAVQAVLPPPLRGVVREHLRELRLPGAEFEVAHPVDAFVVTRSGQVAAAPTAPG